MSLEFRLLRIPVRIHVWFLITGFFLWQLQTEGSDSTRGLPTLLVTIAILAQGVLMHELGHALVGRSYGLSPRIELLALGGLTWWDGGEPLTPRRRILVSFAGPAVGLVLGAPALVWALMAPPAHPVAAYALSFFWFVNFGWAIFNLMPMMPLDGGNIMAAVFEIFSRERGRLMARYVSFGVIGLLVAGAAALEDGLLAVFLAFLAFGNYQGMKAERIFRERLAGLRDEALAQADGAEEDAPEIETDPALDALARGDGAGVVAGAEQRLDEATEVEDRDEAWHLMAWGRLLLEDAAGAREALDQMSGDRAADPALDGAIALATDDVELALERLLVALREGQVDGFVESRLVEAARASGDYGALRERLAALPDERVSPELVHRIEAAAFRAGLFEQAAGYGEWLWERTGHGLAAFNVACAMTRLERHGDAMSWLERARDAEFVDPEVYDQDEDLESLRLRPEWKAFRASLGP
ncbi:MAG: hypothetical protein GXP55_12035 [Deltaproteobacteria bacterium]|nr:hypothetical protein [Deltaproteobacteria bacterium]